jgi:hypothetical protein
MNRSLRLVRRLINVGFDGRDAGALGLPQVD